MSATVIKPGQQVILDPADIRTFVFDWDEEHLAATVTISTSTFTITAIKQADVTDSLTKDNEARLTAAEATTALERTVTLDNRVTRLRLDATTANLGDRYEVANKIVTSESPTQTKERSFFVLVQDL